VDSVFLRFDWLLKLGIVSAVHLLALFWISRASCSSFLSKNELFGAGCPLVYLEYTKAIIHLSLGEEW